MIDVSKYDEFLLKNLDRENARKIILFLLKNECDYVEELLEDYLDLFTFEYDEFLEKFNKLNEEYNNKLIIEMKDDMNILEKFYLV